MSDAAAPDPTVSVVICAYTEGRWPDIERAMASVRRQQVPPERVVLVVDHNPALLARAGAAFPGVTVLPNTGPRGLSGARNTGVAHARGDVVAFLDDDAEAEPDWLARLVAHYRDPAVVAAGGRALPAWAAARPRWLPAEFDWVVGCSYTGQPAVVAPVRNMIGCNMSFRRSALDRVAGFDPALGRVGRNPVGCEETELCIRVGRAHPDGVLLYDPAALVRHRVGEDRATWRYFRRRCFAEGRSKAVVARLAGAGDGLAAERTYTRRTLPDGVRRGLREARGGDRSGLLRSGAIVAGLAVTAAGYARGRASRGTPATPAPIRVLAVELAHGVPALADRAPDGRRYAAAQVLVRLHGQPLGLLELTLPPGGLTAAAHRAAIDRELGAAIEQHLRVDGMPDGGVAAPCPSRPDVATAGPSVTVVVPTCGRVALLERALDSLAAQDYPHREILVVDNAPHEERTAKVVAERAADDDRIRYACEPRPGVSHARNRGLAEATGEIVAFLDDDVTADPHWLSGLVYGFADGEVAAVTGYVLAAELETPAQIWVERYGGFGKGCLRRRFDRGGVQTIVDGRVRHAPVGPGSLYPYLPGGYGSGANMAFRSALLRRLGGFDPRLGAGEDIDALLRVVLAGHALVYEPAAIVWHTHRREVPALRRTIYRYGVGLSAVLAKCLATDAAGRRDLLRRLPRGVAYAVRPSSSKNAGKRDGYPSSLTALELCGLALGPVYYAAAVMRGHR